ncbi:BOI-related E3 ubiquitin-protein ligase 1 [Quillaja saponaria]|uniref:BOI-related E3 ubiquitin-protein ligase 1 n=1 Tax=Quillaja saponaria TaxID=32244 RepID=A0AAD7QIK4_QUISA|nr:BOI-related E3 ubiquitin-protein ligase 1 [Quillaja saponaria]KAJ7982010.1 BOI-related E3 ubiquitin-protein ligase 1 [Quillaja saponaria]
MAVEATHLNLFHPQLIGNREMMIPIEGNLNLYNTQMGYSTVPLSGITTTEALLPAYNSVISDSFPPKSAIKSESGVTYNIPVPRKRSRDSITPFISYPATPQTHKNCSSFSFLGEDISLQIQQQQLDVDRLIAQHMEKVRLEIEEKRKRQARMILQAIEVGMMKRLKAKEEEIEKIGKLNWDLEQKVKTLFMENQVWRDLAQTNEATANTLRTNLEQVLQQVRGGAAGLIDDDAATPIPTAALMDDAQSCCGSNTNNVEWDEMDDGRTLAWRGRERIIGAKVKNQEVKIETSRGNSSSNCRLCRNCGKEESCVLILPCRHLCLCTVCGSTLHTCPICKSIKNASVHINMSS